MYRAYRNDKVISQDGLPIEFEHIADALAFLEMEYGIDIPMTYTLGNLLYDDPEELTQVFQVREVTKV